MAMSIDEAIQHCEEMALCAKNGECGEEHRQLAEWLRELKRLRAEPVRHGRWGRSGQLLECQCCGEVYSQLGGNAGKAWNFCPNCGADMRGSNDE